MSGAALEQLLEAGDSAMAAAGRDQFRVRHSDATAEPRAKFTAAAAAVGGRPVLSGATDPVNAASGASDGETRAFECATIATGSRETQRALLVRHELDRDAALEEPQHAVGGWIDFAIGVAVDDGHVQVLAPSVVEMSLMVAVAELPSAGIMARQTPGSDDYDDDDDEFEGDDNIQSESTATGSVKAAQDLLDALVCTKQRRMRLLGVSSLLASAGRFECLLFTCPGST